VELQRLQMDHSGMLCYRLIHCVARKGLEWSHTLDELLAAPDIQLDVPDSQGHYIVMLIMRGIQSDRSKQNLN